MKRVLLLFLMVVMILSITACGNRWTCDRCGKTFSGKAYYGMDTTETFCEDCARSYWMPLPYQNYQKKKESKKESKITKLETAISTDIENAEDVATNINISIADGDIDAIQIESGVAVASRGGKTVLTRRSDGKTIYLPDSKVQPGAEWTIYFDNVSGVTKIVLDGAEIWPTAYRYEDHAKQ